MSTPKTRPFITLPADQPDYETLVELTLAQRAELPGRFHTPVWLDAIPGAFVCTVCWDEAGSTAWPCKPAIAAGRHLFSDAREPAPVAPATEDPAPRPVTVIAEHHTDNPPFTAGWSWSCATRECGAVRNGFESHAAAFADPERLAHDHHAEDPAPREPRWWRSDGAPEPDDHPTVRDSMRDVWTYNPDTGLYETPDTQPMTWARIAKKYGPLTEVLSSALPTPGGEQ